MIFNLFLFVYLYFLEFCHKDRRWYCRASVLVLGAGDPSSFPRPVSAGSVFRAPDPLGSGCQAPCQRAPNCVWATGGSGGSVESRRKGKSACFSLSL